LTWLTRTFINLSGRFTNWVLNYGKFPAMPYSAGLPSYTRTNRVIIPRDEASGSILVWVRWSTLKRWGGKMA